MKLIKITTKFIQFWMKDGKVTLAKCQKTGRFVSKVFAQAFVLNVKKAVEVNVFVAADIVAETEMKVSFEGTNVFGNIIQNPTTLLYVVDQL